MIKRTENHNGIRRSGWQVQVTRIASRGVNPGQAGDIRIGPELLDVQRHEITVLDLVPEGCQPERVPPGTAADVGDEGRSGSMPQ